jgi:hypothetical protein
MTKLPWLAFVLLVGCLDGEPMELSEVESEVTWGPDNRVAFRDADFAAGQARAIGVLTGPGICTATHIGDNLLLTARHCFSDTTPPNSIVFRPGFTGPFTTDNLAARPSITVRRFVRGTGSDRKFNQSPPGTYFPGNDWALLEVDPATYNRGTGGFGIPWFPYTWTGWPSIPLGSPPNPITSSITVADVGYSVDRYATDQAPTIHTGCRLRRDGVCSNRSAEGDGVVITDCEANPGASGGPVMSGWPNNPRILAINGGNGFTAACYNDNIGNILVNVNGVHGVPRNAAGVTFTRMGNGVTLAVAADGSSAGQVMWNNFDSADGFHPRHRWRTWSDGFLHPLWLGRMTSAFTGDGHAFIFAQTSSGIVHRYETYPGVWSPWMAWNWGSAMSHYSVDLEATSAGAVAVQLFTVHGDGKIRTRRKMVSWDWPWEGESAIATVPGARAIGVGTVQGYQQLFVIDQNRVLTIWETNPSWNVWTGLFDFTPGLPAGAELLDITVGLDQLGRMDVYVLVKESDGSLAVWNRTKSTATAGTPFSEWARAVTVPAGATQLEVGPVFGDRPRLAIVRDGELMMRRPIQNPMADFWAPAYSAEPTPTSQCPPPDLAACQ